MKVLSIRQPWAWYILCEKPGWKNIENRTWPTDYRGWIYVHAAKTLCPVAEWQAAEEIARRAGLQMFPDPKTCLRGGIVGMVQIVGCVQRHRSPWFAGPFGYVLADPEPWPFEPCAGQLGLYDYGTLATPKWPSRDERH